MVNPYRESSNRSVYLDPEPRRRTFPPRMARRTAKATIVVFVTTIVVATISACSPSLQPSNFVFPTAQDIACAANDIENNVTNPVQIATDCPGLAQVAAADLSALINGLLNAKTARAAKAHAGDAGAKP
jgi:hypothetical protein